MASINWNDGQLLTLNQGDTATCTGNLNRGQIYALFFYNAAGNDADTTVIVTGNSAYKPVSVTVPGTTGNQGLAAMCFVSGTDTSTIAASIVQGQPGSNVQAFIGSVKMPMGGSGINNASLPLDGQLHPFNKFTRYYAVPASHWYSLQIASNINAFTSVMFTENSATVYGVNAPAAGLSNIIAYYGPSSEKAVTVNTSAYQSVSDTIIGNGSQYVWINADSVQNAQSATISVQSLQSLF